MTDEAANEGRDASTAEPKGGAETPAGSPASLVRLSPEILPPRRTVWMPVSYGVLAAGVAVLLGGGVVASAQLFAGGAQTARVATAAPQPDPNAALLHHVEDEVRSLKVGLDALRANPENGRQDEAIRALKKSVDGLKGDIETVRASTGGAVAQLGAKIDKLDRDPGAKLAEVVARLDRVEQAPSPKLAEIASRLDRIEHEPAPRLGDITARLDRIEKQVSSPVPTGAIGPATRGPVVAANVPLPTPAPAAAPDAKPKPAALEGWLLRDVYGGVALVEGREGRLREVAPGEVVPGVGEIRSIERRGRSWVVVTSRGIIEADNRF